MISLKKKIIFPPHVSRLVILSFLQCMIITLYYLIKKSWYLMVELLFYLSVHVYHDLIMY
jgi:hypothetical protein